jgi:hypothetical protein
MNHLPLTRSIERVAVVAEKKGKARLLTMMQPDVAPITSVSPQVEAFTCAGSLVMLPATTLRTVPARRLKLEVPAPIMNVPRCGPVGIVLTELPCNPSDRIQASSRAQPPSAKVVRDAIALDFP